MAPIIVTAAGPSEAKPINLGVFPTAGVGLVLTINGALTASVQVTGDNRPYTNHWVDLDGMVAKTASALGNLAFPVTAVRLNVTNYTSGFASLAIIEGLQGPR